MIHLLIFMSYLISKIAATDECGKQGFDPGTFAISADDDNVRAPWTVAIGQMSTGTDGEFNEILVFCSGAVLTPRIVVTAAHCEDKAEYVRAGVNRIDQTRAQDRKIVEFKTHPEYQSTHNILFGDISCN